MKTQFYPIARKLRNFVALILTLFIIGHTCAQNHVISGDASNYNFSNSYPGATVNGDLLITANVFNLAALGDDNWENLQTVTGDLTISGTSFITNINGLQHLTSVGGDLIIQNNISLQNITALTSLQSIGGDLIVQNNNVLTYLNGLENVLTIGGSILVENNSDLTAFSANINWALQSVQNVTISDNPSLVQLFPFLDLININNITIANNTNLTFLAAFLNLQTAGNITIRENPSLTDLGGFDKVQSAGNINIISNTVLTSSGGFPVMNSLNYLEINNNPNLSACCWATHLIDIAVAPTAILANAPGCESVAVVNAPPTLDMCVPSATVNTSANTCENVYSMRLPIAADNCDFLSQEVKITLGDGSIWHDGPYGGAGSNFDYTLKPGINTFAFEATDENGNSTTCNSIITVVDNQAPKAVAAFNFNLDNIAGSNCMGTFTPPVAGFTDNCGISQFQIEFQNSEGNQVNESFPPGNVQTFDLEIGSYSYLITSYDLAGNSVSQNGVFSITDDTQPEWENNITSKVIEVECGEATIEEILQANYPTALDACSEVTLTIADQDFLVSPCGLDLTEYEFIASDPSNTNMTPFRLHINEVDTKKPVLSGVPNNITIGCNDPIPPFPTLTAMDACSGNLTSQISFTEIPGMGTCGNGQIAQILSRSAIVSDDCDNTATAQWTVTVLSDFSFTLGDDINLCGGGNTSQILSPGISAASYIWSTGATSQTINVTQAGTYTLTVTTSSGCCYVDDIDVNIGAIPNISAIGGTLDCTSGTVQIMGSSTSSGAAFSWTGPGNFSSSIANPTISTPGNYTLTVTSPEGCENTQTVTVDSDTNVPNASATGGSLSCNTESIQIKGTSTTSGVSYSWTGPNNFQSSVQNPLVSSTGTYTLTVTGPNGCKSISTTEVIGNTDVPAITLNADKINCNNLSVSILIESDAILVSTEWTGPNNFSSSEKEPKVDLPGTYIVTVQSINGCEIEFTIDITEDLIVPDVMAEGGTISCDENSILLASSSTDINATFLWSGPDNFTSNIKNPEVTQPGSYIIMATGLNGCSVIDSVAVLADNNLPNISAIGGTINCMNEEVTIIGSSSTEDVTSSWSGPNGFASNSDSNDISVPGLYTFTVVSPGGCTSFKTVEIILDNSDPDLAISSGTVDCNSQTRQFNIVTNTNDPIYNWEGPDGFSSDLPFPSYSLAGTYNLTITATNGCTTSQSIVIDEDIALDAEVITSGSNAEINVINGTGPYTFIWDAQFGTMSISDLVDGEHSATVIDGFGCSKNYNFIISTSSIYDNQNKGSIEVYPNPTYGNLIIKLTEIEYPLEYTIYSIQGTKINSGKLNTSRNSIDVEEYRSGIYLLSFRMNEETKVLKFVKK